ncbi:MAG TPA: gephyrin-like molybdotransferase Glp [Terriglobales bacterium]|nr:gephyrin-like molybdotransferase Glp [Terriglobales bacterium]
MTTLPPLNRVLTFEDARHLVEQHASGLRPTHAESMCLLDSAGRILAEPIFADRDFPPFRRATRDGYAVRAADLGSLPVTLNVVGEIKAGASANSPTIANGQAAAIMTGAAAPIGSDAVVMVEYTAAKGSEVEITRGVFAGENIVPSGAEAKCGDQLLTAGTRVDHRAIAVAASIGKSQLHVYKKPRVAILATGDEIVQIDSAPGPFEIRNSNSYSLAAQVAAVGGDPVVLSVAPDETNRLRELIAEGFKADLLLLSGGVSMGKYDLVEQVLTEFGAEFFFTGAQIQPGRPIVFGKSKNKYFFGLPGNPISTMVTFELFVRPILDALAGLAPQKLMFMHAKLKAEIKAKTGLTRFLPAILSGEFDQTEVEIVQWQGSGDIAAAARANCYVVIPPDRDRIAAGEWIAVLKC